MTIYVRYRVRRLAGRGANEEGSGAGPDRFALEGYRRGWERVGRYRDRAEAERVFAGIAGRAYRSGTANGVDLDAHLAARCQVACVWSAEDVLTLRPDLSGAQAWEVLRAAARRYELTGVLGWEMLEAVARAFYPLPSA